MEITLVIPTYNESENLPILLERVYGAFRSANLDGKVIIVDDNSPDGTWKRAEELKGAYPGLEVLRRIDKRGLSSAVLDGFDMSKSEIIGVMDADLSHPPEKIPEMVEPLLKGEADIVIGSRYIESGGTEDWALRRKISSRVATLAVIGLTRVKDPMSGFFFLKREVIENVELSPKGFKIALEILVRGKYDKVVEVPIIFRDRIYGETKLSGDVILDYLYHVAKLYGFKILKS
ncbi:MAG TPA: polyprenol monophosphomannose synthase [Thermodesulfobacteriota bacterium]|nr:polyprenol monophosphomannose synthase [Thermodesulfobacteriota bacterium]